MSQQSALTPRDEHPPKWALVLFALALIAGVALLFRWLEGQDEQNRVAGQPSKFFKSGRPEEARPEDAAPEERPSVVVVVTELKQLLESSHPEEELLGRQVELEDVPVQDVVGNYTFWVGSDEEARVPVVLLGELMQRQPEKRVQVRTGGRVRVFGVVREMRDVDTLDEARFLSAREREELRRSPIYISALRVVTLGE